MIDLLTECKRMRTLMISAQETVLDIVTAWPGTVEVFRCYDEQAGLCICCQMLFEPLHRVASACALDLDELLARLNACAVAQGRPS